MSLYYNIPKKASILELHENLTKEIDDEGNIEYKIHIIKPTEKRIQKLITQMKWRISEGSGICIYYIGINDNGKANGISYKMMIESLNNLKIVSDNLKYEIFVEYFKKGISGGFCSKVVIINNNSSLSY